MDYLEMYKTVLFELCSRVLSVQAAVLDVYFLKSTTQLRLLIKPTHTIAHNSKLLGGVSACVN